MDFCEIWYWRIFQKSIGKIQVSLIYDKNNAYFIWKPTYSYENISVNSSQNENCITQICRERKHFLCSITFSRKSCRLWHNVARQPTDDSIIRDKRTKCWITNATVLQTHTHRICNNYCFPIVTMVTRTHTNVNVYLHFLPFCFSRNVQTGSESHPAPIQWVPADLSLGLKWAERKGDKTSPLTAEVKNEWSFITTSLYAFMEYTRTIFPSLHNCWIEMRRRIIW